MKNKYFTLLCLIGLVVIGCKNDDDLLVNPNIPVPDGEANVSVQDFMYRAMNTWYFWKADVPDLADDRFTSSEEYTSFLESEENPSDFFDELLFSEDRFSRSSDDYKTWTNALSGISKSNGLEFGLVRLNQSDTIFGIVRYIIPNSDASTKAISRGDIFMGVNGTTLNDDNYVDLLFGDADSYTLNMATIENNELMANDIEINLTKNDGLVEDPIFLDKIFEINGKKIGYLVYNSFTDEYDEDLNEVFGRFVAGQVEELVLDLRYNSGGDVNTSRLLSSMIHGLHTDKVFLTQRWNAQWQAFFGEDLVDYFADKTRAGTQLNTLNLSKVYVLATYGSASASELLINCLTPHMEVIHIGDETRGKNEFSLTFVDDLESPTYPYLFLRSREDKINPSNSWALQPLCGRNENADGFSDYTSGLVPDIELQEDLSNYGVLGDQNEPLLARAIQEITSATGKRSFEVQMPTNLISDSKMFSPLGDRMFITNLNE
ncbi:S41 family peptidase [Aurantibacter sp.]|uniref:S41 family peptidase n=1 Tax=Aurantibacter sp. TaxID=2807103 RepID=UPI0032647023